MIYSNHGGIRMRFNEKFDLLMNLLNIPNNKLAKFMSVDPSLISRWRSGDRDPLKNDLYVTLISEYIVQHTADPQYLYELVAVTPNEEGDNLKEAIAVWLRSEYIQVSSIATKFLNQIQNYKDNTLPFNKALLDEAPIGERLKVEVYHGREGKRKGVVRFLTSVILSNKLTELLLYSDEPMDWLMEDLVFTQKWALMLAELMRIGHKIKIIHTVDRDANEQIVAIERWLPLYLSGQIEPYYYPNYQETLFKKTLFIAPGIAALTSSAIAGTESMEQIFYHDTKMIQTLTEEFNTYLKVCRPLMKIYSEKNLHSFHELLFEFEGQEGDMITLGQTLPFATLSYEDYRRAMKDSAIAANNQDYYIDYYTKRHSLFYSHLKNNKRCDWINLSFLSEQSCINLDTFMLHPLNLESSYINRQINTVERLIKENKHYSLRFCTREIPHNIFLAFKKNTGVIIYKTDPPHIVFAINHPLLLSAFESFIEEITTDDSIDNRSSIEKLHQLLIPAFN